MTFPFYKALFVLIGMSITSIGASAQEFPSRPIKFVVPYPPGGGTDFIARIIGQSISSSTGQPVVVDNKPGANEIIATELTARAPPDGYTIQLISSTFASNVSLQKKLPYATEKDFAAVSYLVSYPLVIAVPSTSQFKTLRELVDYSKANPDKLTYGSLGQSGLHAITTELFAKKASIKVRQIPYKGIAPAMLALASGEVDMGFATLASAFPQLSAGKIRILGVSTPKRVPALQNVPSIAESYPGFAVTPWFGVIAPAKTPSIAVKKLNTEISAALNNPDVRAKLATQGLYPEPMSVDNFRSFLTSEVALWSDYVKDAGIQPE